MVRNLAVTRWRLARVAAIETNLFDNELSRAEKEIDEEFSEITDLGKLAHVFGKLADHSQALSLLIRYENSLTRTCDRIFKHLLTIQKLRNEPKPEPPDTKIQDSQRVSGGRRFRPPTAIEQPISSQASTPPQPFRLPQTRRKTKGWKPHGRDNPITYSTGLGYADNRYDLLSGPPVLGPAEQAG